MADYTIAPNSNGQPRINGLPFPIPYVGSTGYALYNYLQEISAEKIIPYMKDVSTAEFISGNYTSFQSPVGYTIPPYTLPFFETSEVLLNSDTIKVFTPHKGYIIGSATDRMTGNFPIRVFEEDYNSNSVVIPPLGFRQTFRIIIYKTASSLIDFTTSNIANNGLELEKIAPLTRIEFECQRDDSDSILITRWITPSVQDLPVPDRQGFTSVQQGNATGQNPSAPISIGQSLTNGHLTLLSKNEINQGAIVITPDGLIGTAQVKDSAITAAKLANSVIEQKLGYIPANVGGTNWNANAVSTSLGYIPANVGGTNWNANAVPTSLGYTPAKIGDSWISRKISFISPTGWTIVNNFASSPDLSNFTLFLPQSTNPNAFAFGLQKGASKIETGLYTVSVTPFLPGGSSFIGPSAFYLKPSAILGVNTYAIYNANVYLVLGSSNAVTYQTMVAAYDFNVIIYFSKNL